MKKVCFFVLILLISVSFPLSAGADTVKLKKGGNLTGVIKQEDNNSITLQIGMGTMRIQKSEIEFIRKAGEKENDVLEGSFRRTAIERGTFVPPGLEEMAQKLRGIAGDRKSVDDVKFRLDFLKQKLDADSDKLRSMRADFDKKNSENMNPKSDVRRYNDLVTEFNTAGGKISDLSEGLNKMNQMLPEYQTAYWKAITEYGNEIGDFGIYLDKTSEDLKKRGITDDEALYLETVSKSLAYLQKGLNRDEIAVSKSGNGMTVKTVLNGEVTCLLAVDTGATVIVISKSIADRLEINPNDSLEDVQFTLADGSIIKSKVVKIKSVRVGNSTVHDVSAAVVDKPPVPEVDGLLGMSFLNNFNIKMDVANGKLILETIK